MIWNHPQKICFTFLLVFSFMYRTLQGNEKEAHKNLWEIAAGSENSENQKILEILPRIKFCFVCRGGIFNFARKNPEKNFFVYDVTKMKVVYFWERKYCRHVAKVASICLQSFSAFSWVDELPVQVNIFFPSINMMKPRWNRKLSFTKLMSCCTWNPKKANTDDDLSSDRACDIKLWHFPCSGCDLVALLDSIYRFQANFIITNISISRWERPECHIKRLQSELHSRSNVVGVCLSMALDVHISFFNFHSIFIRN